MFRALLERVWADFVHKTDELVVLAEDEIEIEIEGKVQRPQVREEVFIPANALYTVRNVGVSWNVWYYGYKKIIYKEILVSGEELYLYATEEVDGKDRDQALWAKSMAICEGDDKNYQMRLRQENNYDRIVYRKLFKTKNRNQ